MLNQNYCALIVLDVQVCFLKTIAKYDSERGDGEYVKKVLGDIKQLLISADGCGLPIFYTKFQNPLPAFKEVLEEEPVGELGDLVFVPRDPSQVYQNNSYNLPVDLKFKLRELSTQTGKPVLIAGFETDAFVLGACFDLWNECVPFRVSRKHVASGNFKAHEYGISLIVRQFLSLDERPLFYARNPSFLMKEGVMEMVELGEKQ